ncbi:MAG: hypothetical protein AAB542_02270 [Patescibacteria group bacterium]
MIKPISIEMLPVLYGRAHADKATFISGDTNIDVKGASGAIARRIRRLRSLCPACPLHVEGPVMGMTAKDIRKGKCTGMFHTGYRHGYGRGNHFRNDVVFAGAPVGTFTEDNTDAVCMQTQEEKI